MGIADFGARSLQLHSPHRRMPAKVLDRLRRQIGQDDLPEDLVPRLERRMAALLGKPAAALFPTGTMAQQVALRIHADRRGVRTVVFHPCCHLEVHEQKGYAVVHGLTAWPAGDRNRLITMDDLTQVAEPVAALLLELPQRDIGGQLPAWDELVAQVGWARERNAAAHLDGARLWEAQPYYGRPHAEIAALFDTVYVSLYKGLMAPSGAMLAGDEEFIGHAGVWRRRLGGTAGMHWPVALAAEYGLDVILPRMPEFAERARRIAGLLDGVRGIHVVPDPPQTPLFHIHLDAGPEAVRGATAELLAERDVYVMLYSRTSASPHSSSFELTVGEQLDDFTDDEVVGLLTELAKRAAKR